MQLPGFIPGKTLFCGNMAADLLLQVHLHLPPSLRHPGTDIQSLGAWWNPDARVLTRSNHADLLILARPGRSEVSPSASHGRTLTFPMRCTRTLRFLCVR